MPHAPRERSLVTSDNVRLFVRDWGDPDSSATPVLCLPGLTRNSSDFLTLARDLSGQRRVVCPDLRGRGRSHYAPDWQSYTPIQYLDDIRHLLAALGLGRVVVIGVSLGGLLALAMAAAFPTALAGIVVNDVGPDVAPTGATRILGYVGQDRPQPDWPGAIRHLREMFPKLSLSTDEDWLAFAQGTFRAGDDGQLHFDWDPAIVRPILEPSEPPPDLWNLGARPAASPCLPFAAGRRISCPPKPLPA